MENNLEKALADLVRKAIEGVDKSVDFMESQLPEVVEQAMTWHALKSGISFVSSLIAIALITYGLYRFIMFNCKQWPDKAGKDESWARYYEYDLMIYPIIAIIAPFVFIILFCSLSLEWLQILIAPKLWLIEYASGIIK